MGSWSEQQEANKERKEKDKTRRDKLAGYFFNLSQLTFVALVLGGVTPLYTNIEVGINWYILVAGITLTIILANIGNLILKQHNMEMLAAIFTAGIIVAGAFLIWLKTKSGKKWLASL